MTHRRVLSILFVLQVLPPALLAQRTTNLTTGSRRLDPAFIVGIIDGIPLTADRRAALLSELKTTLAPDAPVTADISHLLSTVVPAAQADLLAQILVTRRKAKLEDGSQSLFSSVTAAGNTERLYSTVEVYSYRDGRFSASLVSAVAVSEADAPVSDTGPPQPEQIDLFRRRTSEVLSAVHDGGPVALHLNWDLNSRAADQPRGVETTVGATIARSGTFDGPGNVAFGVAMEAKGFSRRFVATSDKPVQEFIVTGRIGGRYANGGIITGDARHEHLGYIQLVIEMRSPLLAMPLGVSLTQVTPKNFVPLQTGFQIFGMAGR